MMIKNRMKFVLTVGIGLSLFSGLSQAMFLKKGANDRTLLIPNPSAPARLGALALIHDDEGFSVLNKSEIRRIPNHLVARDLRGIPQSEVTARLDNNINFRVQQGSDGEFSLQECGGLDGGNPPNTTDAAILGLLVGGGLTGLYKTYNALQPTFKQQNEDNFQQAKLDYTTCLLGHPLEENIEDKIEIPSACIESFKKFTMIGDAIKVREATRLVENEHNAQKLWIDFNACTLKNPLSEDAEGAIEIPSACIGAFNKLTMGADAV